jgi:hypothetical protein
MQIVKVRYAHSPEGREYTYFSSDILKVGDKVSVPVKDHEATAIVSQIDVPESEIAKYKDSVKLIAHDSILKDEPITALSDIPAEGDHAEGSIDAGIDSLLAGIEEIGKAPAINQHLPPAEPEKAGDSVMIVIHPEKNASVINLKAEIVKLLQLAQARVVTSDADLNPITDDLILISKLKKAVIEQKDIYVKPIKVQMTAVSEIFSDLIDTLDSADDLNREKFCKYKDLQEAKAKQIIEVNRQAQEVARKQAELNQGVFTVETAPIPEIAPVKSVSTGSGSLSTYQVPMYEVVDFKLLPDEYKKADIAKIASVVKASKGMIVIAGVKITFKDQTVVNTR